VPLSLLDESRRRVTDETATVPLHRFGLFTILLAAGTCVLAAAATEAPAAPPGILRLSGHDDGRLDGRFENPQPNAVTEGLSVVCRVGGDGRQSASSQLTTKTGKGGAWTISIPDDWRARSAEVLDVTVGEGDAAAKAVYPLRNMPLTRRPPPTEWGECPQVDEPEGAFHSLGRTPWHFGHNADLIAKFHGHLRESRIEPTSLLDGAASVPATTRRILIEPEELPACGWNTSPDKQWIVCGPMRYGPEARLPLRIDRGGLYRLWIRFRGFKDGVTPSVLTLYRSDREPNRPVVTEEYSSRPAGVDGPRWHDILVDLEPGEYVIALGQTPRYYQTAPSAPSPNLEVDCLYVADELWRDPPSDEERQKFRNRTELAKAQRTESPPLAGADRDAWRLWQVRPIDWDGGRANPRLFAASQAFWRREIAALAEADYTAPPLDPVAKSVPDYRDPRRQVVFDSDWNMVGNPHRIRLQRNILESDLDPTAKDAFYEMLFPGTFPVVEGQWNREGGSLTAWDAATNGLAAGTFAVPRAGRWNLWVQFKNINYFEYFGVRADTLAGRQAVWERTERLYPGGRVAWAKVGAIDVPELSAEESAAHLAAAARGVFVEAGRPVFAAMQGEWRAADGCLEAAGEAARILAKSGLPKDGDCRVRARLSVAGLAGSAAAFTFRESNGVKDNVVLFEGRGRGAAFGAADVAFEKPDAVADGKPFDFEWICEGKSARVLIDGRQVLGWDLADRPGPVFGFRPGKGTLRLHEFSASGALDDGLALARQVTISLWMDKYINARTYRGVYALLLTDDPDHVPEGTVAPKASPRRYFRQLESLGFKPDRGYMLNPIEGPNLIGQTWIPSGEPAEPVIDLVMARDAVRSASLAFRSGSYDPLTLTIQPGPLTADGRRFPGTVRWRAVAFAPYADGREGWSPFFLLRRPFLALPSLSPAQAWLTVDTTGVPPGSYESRIDIDCKGADGRAFPRRTVKVRVRVAPVEIAPRRPILVHGWVSPPPGEDYAKDWFRRFSVWQGPPMSKAEMKRRGVRLQAFATGHATEASLRAVVKETKSLGLDYDDWVFSVLDEPAGQTEQELAQYISIAKLIRQIDPRVRIMMNPGEPARAATFAILQPYVDLWNPYALHLSFAPSGRDYLKKPWIWYSTPCYLDKTPGISAQIYEQVRSVTRQPGDCLGTAFFAPYYPWRDPWDTAYEHIRDVSVFVLPSRHGPVATPTWETLLEAVQHANLAQMVRERARPEDAKSKALWENGDSEAIVAWLEKNRPR
jgi:hypothetical protein